MFKVAFQGRIFRRVHSVSRGFCGVSNNFKPFKGFQVSEICQRVIRGIPRYLDPRGNLTRSKAIQRFVDRFPGFPGSLS